MTGALTAFRVVAMVFAVALSPYSVVAKDDIYQAAYAGKAERVAEILDQRPEMLNQPDHRGDTPLHHAGRRGHVNVVATLIERGASLDAKDRVGVTPAQMAAAEGRVAVARLLAEKGAAVDVFVAATCQELRLRKMLGEDRSL